MQPRPKPIRVHFWCSGSGREPVREFLQNLSKIECKSIGNDVRRLQFGWPIGMPLVRKLGSDLWELRSTLPSKREARIMFAMDSEKFVMLHAFIKKSQKTPRSDLMLSRQRLKELLP